MITTTGWDGTGAPHPNSCRINIAVGDTLLAAMDAIEAFLLAHSWELWDAAAGTNARAYRCQALPDAIGAIHYGYIVLDYNTAGYLLLKHYESWNAVTHVGTNLASFSNEAALHNQVFPAVSAGSFSSGGWLKIQASHLGIYLLGNNGSASGTTGDNGPTFVVQTARTCPEDLVSVGFAKWTWGCSYRLGLGVNEKPVSFSRTRGGGICGVMSAFGACGRVNNLYLSAPILMPAAVDNLTGQLYCSNLNAVGYNTTVVNTEVMGTLLDLIALTYSQGVVNSDDVTFLADDDADYGGAAFVHAHGAPHTWWLIGGTSIRLAVRK